MITIILVSLAAICNAITDICTHHFNDSIFSKLPNKYHFWWDNNCVNGSWLNKYNFRNAKCGRKKWIFGWFNKPVQVTDAFHFFKTLWIAFLIAAIVTYVGFTPMKIVDFFFFGFLWIGVFNMFYDGLLRTRSS